MTPSELDHNQYGLLFDVRRSVRYHDRRKAFFLLLHRVTSVLTILLSGGVLFELAMEGPPAGWLVALCVPAAVLSALDLVVGYSTRAMLHDGLRGRFIALESALLGGGADAGTWNGYRQERLRIEKDEPPVYRALDLLCYLELARAQGAALPEGFPEIGWFKRLTSQFLPWPNIAAA